MSKKYFKTSLLGRVIGVKTILCIWAKQYNTIQESLQIFETNCCISLKNCKIYKQTQKQTIWLNSLTEVENTEFYLVEDGRLREISQGNPPC